MRDTGTDATRLSAVGIDVRRTRQRAAVLEALADGRDFVSARDLHSVLTSAGVAVGLTTVYRTLHELERAELVDVVRDEAGGRQYRQRPAEGHRHYLICRHCGLSRAVDSDEVERWAERMSTDSGFAEVEHTLELAGVCADCLPGAMTGAMTGGMTGAMTGGMTDAMTDAIEGEPPWR